MGQYHCVYPGILHDCHAIDDVAFLSICLGVIRMVWNDEYRSHDVSLISGHSLTMPLGSCHIGQRFGLRTSR